MHVPTQCLRRIREKGQPDHCCRPAEQLVEDRVGQPFLVGVQRTCHTEDRSFEVAARTRGPRTFRISAYDHVLSNPNEPDVLKNWGVSVTARTDFTPTPKRPIWPPRFFETLIRRMVSAPSGVTAVPSFAQ